MSRGSYPLLLTMALSAPGAAHALGLGEIHIDSNLNQPLSAQIDLIGASEQDLGALKAAVANRDVFQQMGADRPAFLSTAQFKVTRDAHGRPVLSVRSSEAFTEPVVNLVIELHWPTGALVREYTLLLDPAGLGGQADSALDARWVQTPAVAPEPVAKPVADRAPVLATAPVPATPPESQAKPRIAHDSARAKPVNARGESAPDLPPAAAPGDREPAPATPTADLSAAGALAAGPATYTVRANDTLQGIARNVGAGSAADVRRMMIAMFRTNRDAFDDNINRLRRGSVLQIPDAAALAALSSYEVNRDYRAQMSQWRLAGRPTAVKDAPATSTGEWAPGEPAAGIAAPEERAVAAVAADPAPSAPPTVARSAATSDLEQRIQDLQTSLSAMDEQIAQRDAQLFKLRQQAEAAQATAVAVTAHEAATPHSVEPAPHEDTARTAKRAVALASSLGSMAALIALFRLRRRKPDPASAPASAAAQNAAPQPARGVASDAATVTMTVPATAAMPVSRPVTASAAPGAMTPARPSATKPDPADEETVILDTTGESSENPAMDPTVALSHEEIMADLENTAHHVNMPSDLNSPAQAAPFVERRKSVIDVLRIAIEREPHRRELKMKLLEIYYAAAASNQASFLEIAKALARDRDVLATGDWERIAAMGRAITPNERLFLPDGQAAAEPAKENAA